MFAVPNFRTERALALFDKIPAELPFLSVYFPPFFLTVTLGFVCAWCLAKLLNLIGASRYFWHPALAFFALWVLMSSVLGLTIIPL
jgi:hypothetical protein